MPAAARKPGKGWIWLGGILGAGGVATGVALVLMAVLALWGFSPQRMLAPGKARLKLDQRGSYTIYHEFRSIFDGRVYSRETNLDGMKLRMFHGRTNEEISLRATNSETYNIGQYSGRALLAFDVQQPTEVILSGTYDDGRQRPRTVLAVGQIKIARFVLLLLAGIFTIIGSGSVAAVIIVVAVVRRNVKF